MGLAALEGQPGVLAVVKTVRQQPFGEWNVVYFDPSLTGEARLLARLRDKGCPKAARIPDVTKKLLDFSVAIQNPIVAPGDSCVLWTRGQLVHDAKYSLSLPRGWTYVPGPGLEAGGSRIFVRVPKSAVPGSYDVVVSMPQEDAEVQFTLPVEVVSRVP